jgi:hypothetical protein
LRPLPGTERAYCSVCFQKTAAFAFILFFGEGSPTGDLFSSGSRIGGLFSDGGLTGGFFGSFGGSLLGDLATFFMESILTCSYAFSLDSKGSKSTFYYSLAQQRGISDLFRFEANRSEISLSSVTGDWCVTPEVNEAHV